MYKVTAIVPAGQGLGFSLAGIEILEVSGIGEAHRDASNSCVQNQRKA